MTRLPTNPAGLDRRRLLGLGAAAGALALLPGCETERKVLFSADTHPLGYPTVTATEAFGTLLRERTNGDLSVRIYAGGQLGTESDTLEITIFGGIDLNRVNLAPLNPIAAETFIPGLPFLFTSTGHMRRALDGAPGEAILAALEPHGLIGLCFYDSGSRCFYNTRGPVRSPEDLHGVKIRSPASNLYVAMISAAGGNPTPIPLSETYQALVQGVVDGAENNLPSYESTRHHEVARYFSYTRHVIAPEVLVMSKRRWDRLTPELREIVRTCAKDSVPIMRRLWDAREEEAKTRLVAAGVQFNDDVDTAAFAERMGPVWDRFVTTPRLKQILADVQAMGGADA
ncbi:MAG: hypothetical protein RLY86_1111 [Pseudomonadota bacterium]|jgi:tripartite ATP-independent transporter DctP family solute receptor